MKNSSTSQFEENAEQGDNWEYLDALLQGRPVATFVIDANFKVTHWNQACEFITGVPASEVIGTSDQWRGFYPERRPVLADLIAAGKLEAASAHYEAGHFRASLIVPG